MSQMTTTQQAAAQQAIMNSKTPVIHPQVTLAYQKTNHLLALIEKQKMQEAITDYTKAMAQAQQSLADQLSLISRCQPNYFKGLIHVLQHLELVASENKHFSDMLVAVPYYPFLLLYKQQVMSWINQLYPCAVMEMFKEYEEHYIKPTDSKLNQIANTLDTIDTLGNLSEDNSLDISNDSDLDSDYSTFSNQSDQHYPSHLIIQFARMVPQQNMVVPAPPTELDWTDKSARKRIKQAILECIARESLVS